jgi:hypothetical protein
VVVPCSLTCNRSRTLPNQVSYLKGSSMESFTLGPTPKIDFSCSATTTHLQWLQRKLNQLTIFKITSLSTCGIQYRILAVLNAQGPLFIGWGAEWAIAVICTDAVRTVNLGRPDWQQFDRIFLDFRWKSFLFKSRVRTVRHSRSDGLTFAASNFLIRLRSSGPWGISVRMAELQHTISISTMRASRPW